MKLWIFAASACILAAPAFAQQAQQPADPKTEATERMLLDEMTAHRNWYATAISKDAALQQAQGQLAAAQTQIAALQKQLDTAKEATAAKKALPAPAPAK